ncbi:MAG: 3'-5' exonuclease [Hyphomicrobiaceae bacterium]
MREFVQRRLNRMRLKDSAYAFLFEPPPDDEVVSIDCETTGLNTRKDDIVSIAAIKIRGNHILTSEAFCVTVKPNANLDAESIKIHQILRSDVADEARIETVLPDLLKFIGSRPLVGYWIDFDFKMVNKDVRRILGVGLTNPRIDVSDLYYDRKYSKAPPGTKVDLRFAEILSDLDLPPLKAHNAFDDALSTAQMYVVLKDLKARGVFLKRARSWDAPMPPVG